MKLIPLVCPNCGAKLDVEPGKDVYFCTYCGCKVVPETQRIQMVGDVKVQGIATESSLLDKAYILLESGKFDAADETLERVLDINPRNAKAYIGKLLCSLKCRTITELEERCKTIDNEEYYGQALKYAGEAERKEYIEINENIKSAIRNKLVESKYQNAINLINKDSIQDINEAKEIFYSIKDYKDSERRLEHCKERILLLKNRAKDEEEKLERNKKELKKKILFIIMGLGIVVVACCFLAQAKQKQERYQEAILYLESAHYQEAKEIFESIQGYNNSDQYINYCTGAILFKEGKYEEASEIFDALGSFEQSELKYQESLYNSSINLLNTGEYDKAQDQLQKIAGFRDSIEILKEIESIDSINNEINNAYKVLDSTGDITPLYDVVLRLKYPSIIFKQDVHTITKLYNMTGEWKSSDYVTFSTITEILFGNNNVRSILVTPTFSNNEFSIKVAFVDDITKYRTFKLDNDEFHFDCPDGTKLCIDMNEKTLQLEHIGKYGTVREKVYFSKKPN